MKEEVMDNNVVDESNTSKESANKKEKKHKKNKEIESLLEKVSILEEETLRAKADLINYRKRKDEEVQNLLKFADEDLIISLLPVLDNFERALNVENKSEELIKYLEGFSMIYQNIKDILKNRGVLEIEALGKKFDPTLHHSISSRKEENKEEEEVLEVYQKGYTYKGKVLRPAMVIINE